MNTRDAIFLYTRHIITTSSTKPYSLMKIFLTVFTSREDNSGSIKLKVVILVRETSS